MITIQQITDMQQKQSFRDLLLDADPSWEMVSGYLNGDMYVLYCDGIPAAEALVYYREDLDLYELKNISVCSDFRRRGLARKLILYILDQYRPLAKGMCVGTATVSDAPIALYESCGFTRWFVRENFFTEFYPEPLIEDNGEQCIDMIYLKQEF